jgi:glycosyltransferase involved in cell wall biosynthesis
VNNNHDLRIGYVPASEGLDRPTDRRRFCCYARKRGLAFEIADPSETYDLVVVTASGDISAWSQYGKGKAKVIYEQLDAYLATPALSAKGLLRGVAKYAVGQNRRLLLNYSEGLREMCRRADAVICTTVEQRKEIQQYCGNVHVILDFQGDAVRSIKRDYSAGEILHFVWEGLPENMRFLWEIRDVLREIRKKKKIALHVVTALRYGKYLHGRVSQQRTEDEARKIFDPVFVYAWHEQTCSAVCAACDIALIPIPLDDAFAAGKAENKLLFFWRVGVPTIVSATNAYTRTMQQCGLSMACQTSTEWRSVLEQYMDDERARREAGERGKAFAERQYGEEKLLAQWDYLFESVLGRTVNEPQVECAERV